jgi:hypothetical protein
MVSKEFILETINKNIAAREEEVFGYEFNIKNYELMVERLPAAGEVPADPLIAAQHRLREDLTQRILAERIQLQTAQLVLDVLVAQRTS